MRQGCRRDAGALVGDADARLVTGEERGATDNTPPRGMAWMAF